jgi:hypothetical protein
MKISDDTISREYDNFTNAMVTYGLYDIKTAVITAIEVGEDGDWVAELVQQRAEDYEMNVNDLDIVSEVYNDILQTSRNEIDDLINFDFSNDGADIYTAGNYCATSYDWSDNANETIKDKLIENEIVFEDLSEKCKWFLTQIEANY